jgi:hypothetical protein
MLRKQTLFYTDAVNILRKIYLPKDYTYRDDFLGELIMLRESEHLLTVEIKSEKEVQAVSTMSGKTFKELRDKINSLQCLSSHGNGKYKGWLAILAQCWDYMETGLPSDIDRNSFSVIEDVLVLPYDKKCELRDAIDKIITTNSSLSILLHTAHDYPSDNISVLIYKHDQLDRFFNDVKALSSEQNDGADA